MPNPAVILSRRLRHGLAEAGAWSRKRSRLLAKTPPLATLIVVAARIGFGARGFVYLSVGLLTLSAAVIHRGDAVGTKGAFGWMAHQPFGRVWLILLALGLLAFFFWRMLQAVCDADREGSSREAIRRRVFQGVSGLSYLAMAFSVFQVVLRAYDERAGAIANRARAALLLDMPFGEWLLAGVGVMIIGIGVANIVRAAREDFTEFLSCSERVCRRLAPVARAGYAARGVAYLPLGVMVALAGVRAEPHAVTSFGLALEALERQPTGSIILSVTALGLVAFGAFSFVEARFRRIRPPRDLKPA